MISAPNNTQNSLIAKYQQETSSYKVTHAKL